MFKLYTHDHKELVKGHTPKTLKHQSKRFPNQYLYITDENGNKTHERNSGTWRQLQP